MNFDELWEAVIKALRAKADWLGVAAESIIDCGVDLSSEDSRPPFIHVVCLPSGGEYMANGAILRGRAEITLFCTADPQRSASSGLRTTISILAKSINILTALPDVLPPTEDPQPISNTSDITCISLTFPAFYTPESEI